MSYQLLISVRVVLLAKSAQISFLGTLLLLLSSWNSRSTWSFVALMQLGSWSTLVSNSAATWCSWSLSWIECHPTADPPEPPALLLRAWLLLHQQWGLFHGLLQAINSALLAASRSAATAFIHSHTPNSGISKFCSPVSQSINPALLFLMSPVSTLSLFTNPSVSAYCNIPSIFQGSLMLS